MTRPPEIHHPGRPSTRALLPGILAGGALLLALWSGLIRLGWPLPPLRPTLPMAHGPLMVGGFLGALISLERAVALGRPWGYGAPVAAGLGALLLALGLPGWPGPLFISLCSALLLALMGTIVRMHPATFTWTLAAGAASWLVGNLLWLAGWPIYGVVLWWANFLILTIAGERLELSRLLRPPVGAQVAFVVTVALMVGGSAVALAQADLGVRLAGLGMVLLALWLWRFDIARRRLGAGGQARFIALCLLSGYVWLGVAGGLALAYGGVNAGPPYDAWLHALFLGYVFTMIFGHAPIILPAVLGLPVQYRPRFYVHLVLLHLSLALRVAGDLLLWWPGRQWGGLLNVLVVLLFLGNTLSTLPVCTNGLRRLSSALMRRQPDPSKL